jgi:hypothetical protein
MIPRSIFVYARWGAAFSAGSLLATSAFDNNVWAGVCGAWAMLVVLLLREIEDLRSRVNH